MVNWVEVQKTLVHAIDKLTGLRQHTVEIEPGTNMSFWLPKENLKPEKTQNQKRKKKEKPAVVLVHGFAAEGITTWQFQAAPLTSKYSVYVPDMLFFGQSKTDKKDRSPKFQADCLLTALEILNVKKCTVVGFSYGGMVAFKMAEARPDIVKSLVVSGSAIAWTDLIGDAFLERAGFSSLSEFLLPESVKGLKAQFSAATYKQIWFPDFLLKDYLKVMFNNRKERAELLEGLTISNNDAKVPNFEQRVLLLWGENDNIFNFELAQNLLVQLGERATLHGIKKAGHLVHLERPCIYNRCLREFLAYVNSEEDITE